MKRGIIFSILLWLAAWGACTAQDTGWISPLKSSGAIPEENLTPSFEKYFESRKNIVLELRRKERLLMDKYYLETNYWIDDFQRGGKVLFGHPMNEYINRIADTLLAAQPEVREQIHCYIVKSSVMNAFTTERGNIYINLGLIAKIRTEAELASVLSHEINHFVKKHVLNGFIKKMNIDLIAENNSIEENPGEDLLLSKHNYSEKMEFEADTSGFNLLAGTRYNLNAAVSVCDLLIDADLPFGDRHIEKTFFETPLYSLPDFSLARSLDTTIEENTDKGDKTHPDVPERRALLNEKLQKINTTQDTLFNRFDFLQPKTLFDSIRMMARLELPRVMINENRFEEAIYTAYLLQGIYPRHEYLEKVVAFALTGMMLYKRYPEWADEGRQKYFTGRVKQVYDFFSGLSATEFNLVVIAYLLNALEKNENEGDYKLAFESAIYNFVKSESNFVSSENLEADTAKDFSSVLFRKLVTSGKAFSDALEKQKAIAAKEKEQKEWYLSLTEKQKKALNKKKFSEPVDKILVLNPLSVIFNNNQECDFVESEKSKKKEDKFLEKLVKQKKYNIEFINPLSLDKDDTERFNDYATLKDWMESMADFDESKFNTCFAKELKNISEKYKVRYVLWSGTVSVKYLPVISSDAVIASVLIAPLAPFILLPKLNHDYYSVYFSLVMDLEQNRIVYREFSKVSERKPDRVFTAKTNALLKRMFWD